MGNGQREQATAIAYTGEREIDSGDRNGHSRKSWTLAAVTHGRALLKTGGQATLIEPGGVALIPPMMPFAWDTHDEHAACLTTVTFRPEFPARLAAATPELAPVAEMLDTCDTAWSVGKNTSATVARILRSMANESPAFRAASLVEALVCVAAGRNRAVAGISRGKANDNRRKKKLETYFAASGFPHATLGEACKATGMTPAAFCVFFKRAYDATFTEYVNRKKIDEACRMLRKGWRDLDNVAKAAGFGSATYFIRIFKRETGTTPARWHHTENTAGGKSYSK